MCFWFSSSATEKATLSVKIRTDEKLISQVWRKVSTSHVHLYTAFTFGDGGLHLLHLCGCLLHTLLQLLLCTLTGFKFGLQLCIKKKGATFRRATEIKTLKQNQRSTTSAAALMDLISKCTICCSPWLAVCRPFAMASVFSSLLFISWLRISALFSLWSNSVTGSIADGGSAAEKVGVATKTGGVLLAHHGLFSQVPPLCLQ